MRRGVSIATLAAALAATATAQTWPPEVIGSFPVPSDVIDLTWEYGQLYALVYRTVPMVLILDPTTGSEIASFFIEVPNGARGIGTTDYIPDNIWVSNRLNGFVYNLTLAGSALSSFRCPGAVPYGLGGQRYGFGPDRGYLMVSCRDENQIMRINLSTGTLSSSFAGPATAVIDYDEWLAVDRYTNYLYWNYNGSWEVLDTLPALPRGVATVVSGTTDQAMGLASLVLCRDGYVYRYSGGLGGPVAPTSLGRVKALYR